MRDAMAFFGVPQPGPTVIYEDNQAVVATAHNKGMGTMLKELPPRLVPAFAQTK